MEATYTLDFQMLTEGFAVDGGCVNVDGGSFCPTYKSRFAAVLMFVFGSALVGL